MERWEKGDRPTEPSSLTKEVNEIKKIIMSLPSVPSFRCGVDARNISPDLIPKRTFGSLEFFPYLIWFQCPWLDDRDKIGDLIEQFLLNMVSKLHIGDLMCIGIVNNKDYIDAYRLEDILGYELTAHPRSTDVMKYYDFRGADIQLVKEILKYGYCHQGLGDIHCANIPNHVTLVFQKNESLM